MSTVRQSKLEYSNKDSTTTPIKRIQNTNQKLLTESKRQRSQSVISSSNNISLFSFNNKRSDKDEIIYLSMDYLQHNLAKYKKQTISLKAKIMELEKRHKQDKKKKNQEIQNIKLNQVEYQKQLQGQSKLILQYEEKYNQECIQKIKYKSINDSLNKKIDLLTFEIKTLESELKSTSQMSMSFLRQSQQYKKQLSIQKQKYLILFTDYDTLLIKNQQQSKLLIKQNQQMKRKISSLQMQIAVYVKDKEIQKLLSYEKDISERRKQYENIINQNNSSGGLDRYEFMMDRNQKENKFVVNNNPSTRRRLNFQESSQKSAVKFTNEINENGQNDYIELLKSKIQILENQNSKLVKRNKQFQNLVAKLPLKNQNL